MIALKNNLFSTFMNLFQRSSRSTHVRLSDKANEIFQNSETGNMIIRAISENKAGIVNGKSIVVKNPDDTEHAEVSVEIVS